MEKNNYRSLEIIKKK